MPGQSNAQPKSAKPPKAERERGVFNARVVDPLVSLVTGSRKAEAKPQTAKAKAEAKAEAKPQKAKAKAKPEAKPKPKQADGRLNCRHCGRSYATKETLMRHLADAHDTRRR